jgi:hypothetical protein
VGQALSEQGQLLATENDYFPHLLNMIGYTNGQ